MYNTDKCSPKLCKFARPYYGCSTSQVGFTCCFGETYDLVVDGVKCKLVTKIEAMNNNLVERFNS